MILGPDAILRFGILACALLIGKVLGDIISDYLGDDR